MTERSLIITFPGATVGDANRHAEDLRNQLLEAAPDIKVERRRLDETSMDFGGTLVLVLGTPAVLAAAKALHAFLTRNNAVSLDIKTAAGTLVARGLESKDVPAIVAALSGGEVR